MITYLSTFITGFADVVEKAMPRGTKVVHKEDGLIIYHTPANIRTILQLPFLNNSYILVQEFNDPQTPPIKLLQNLINKPDAIFRAQSQLTQKPTTFRIMATVNNQLIAVDPSIRDTLEQVISRNTLFKTNRTKPDVEFILMKRQNGKAFFTLRLTHHENYEHTLKKGELYPELAYMLCLLSEPKKEDVFLDPFCGSGSLAFMRAKYFPAERIYATDTDKSATNYALLKAKKIKRRIDIFNWNALDLYLIMDNSVTRIVTDPPWRVTPSLSSTQSGILSLQDFYTSMFREFLRILAPRGIIILLIEDQRMIENILTHFPELKILKKLTTLISGRKAAVYKIIKL